MAFKLTGSVIVKRISELLEKLGLTSAELSNYSVAIDDPTKAQTERIPLDKLRVLMLNSGVYDYRGLYDASVNLYPSSGGSGTGGTILKGNRWVVSVGGTIDGNTVIPDMELMALIDSPGQTSANWFISLAGGGGGTDTNAIHVNADNEISGITAKTTPVDDDITVIEDSEATPTAYIKKKLSWANIKATLKTYFDTLYSGLTGKYFDATVGSGGDYATLNLAIAASKYRLKAVGNFSLSDNISLSANVRIDLNSFTFACGAYNVTVNSGYKLKILGSGDITFALTSAGTLFTGTGNHFIFGDAKDAIVITNTSTADACRISDSGHLKNVKAVLPNRSTCGFGTSSPGFTGVLENCTITGGGSSCTYAIRSYGSVPAYIINLLLDGTFAATNVIYSYYTSRFLNIRYASTSTSTIVVGNIDGLQDISGKLTVYVYSEAAGAIGTIFNSVCGALKLSTDAMAFNCRFKGAVVIQNSVSNYNFKAINCTFDSTLQMGYSAVPLTGVNLFLQNCTVTGAATMAFNYARIQNCTFNAAATLEAGSGYNIITGNQFNVSFTNNSVETTNIIDNNIGISDIKPNQQIYLNLAGTGIRFVTVAADGTLSATEPLITGKLSDATAISNLTNAGNWTGVNYTGTAITGTFEGQYYDDGTYYYYAYSDNDWRRVARV